MSDAAAMETEAQTFKDEYERVKAEIGKVIVGQTRVVECALIALFAGGHILLEGVPGMGKTVLVKTLSEALELDFNRIQFTPDLMPADIIGTNVMQSTPDGGYAIEFRQGPIFTQLLLADEINRATPKTQSAMLETMQEGSVTTAGTHYTLEQPFLVMATQNPIEQEGTYPLPEAQLDRFLFRVDVDVLSRADLNEVAERTIVKPHIPVERVLTGARIMELRRILDNVVIAEPIRDFTVRLVMATHPQSEFATDEVQRFVRWGASPRAVQALLKAARVRALTNGRVHIAHEDIRAFAREVLQHRVLLNYDGQAENISVAKLVTDITTNLPEETAS